MIPEHGDRVKFVEGYEEMSDDVAEYVGLEGLVVAGHKHVMNPTGDTTLVHFDENPTDRPGGPRYWIETDSLEIVNPGEGFDAEDDPEEMSERSLDRVKTKASEMGLGDTRGAMLIVAGDDAVETYPFLGPEVDARVIGLWMLAAMMHHVADSAKADMPPLEAAQWANHIAGEYDPDATAEEVFDAE